MVLPLHLQPGHGAVSSCGKTRYRDRIAALLALSKIARRDDTRRPKTEQRAYPCPRCHGWHLTSQPLHERHSS